MYIYLIVVWNTIIHFERDFSTTKNQRIVTRDQPFPSAAVSICIIPDILRRTNTQTHPTTQKLGHMMMSYLVMVGGGTHHSTTLHSTSNDGGNNLYFNCEKYFEL